MKMFGFGKKCEYCRTKIENGKEVRRSVEVPGYVGIREKSFCSSEHADAYEKEAGKVKPNSGKSCCG